MRSVIVLAILYILLSAGESSGKDRYVFKRLNNEDGLSYNTIMDIAQEESGIIWFASKQGLNKYDSYHIKNYYREDSVGLPSNFTTSLLVTSDDRLFIGANQGLAEYNRRFDIFDPLLYDGKNLPAVNTIFESENGTILIGTVNGIFAYYPDQEMMVKLISLQNQSITSMVEYEVGLFMVTSTSGVYVVNSDGILLEYYNKTNTPSLPTNWLTKIYLDTSGKYWIGTGNEGLFQFDKSQNEFSRFELAEFDLAETKVIRDIEEDHEGNIWVTSELGIFIIDNETNDAINIQHSLEKSEYYLSDNAVYCLFRSKEDIMWIGSYFGGVNYTDLRNQKGFYNIYPGDNANELRGKAVNKLYKDSEGKLWIATEDGGACTFDTESKEILNYFQSNDINGLSSNNIHAICEDKNGHIWFGHFMTGIDIYNPVTGQFRNISIKPRVKYSIEENSVYSICKDSNRDIWVGSRQGVYKYDYEREQLIPFMHDKMGQSFIYHIMEDSKGQFWFCIRLGGIACYNVETNTLKKYNVKNSLSTNKIIVSMEDTDGRIWFGTVDGGINIYRPKSDSFELLTVSNGLPNNTVYGLLESKDGKVWFSTNQGLSAYDYPNRSIRNYNLSDGLSQMQFNYGSYFKDEDGTMYFGHINGLTYFNPADVSDNVNKPQLLFTDFKLSNQSIPATEEGILKYPINDTKQIELNYQQKSFTIDFVAVNHISARNNTYYYYLEGFEDNWIEMGNKNSATYTNLSPGRYTFKLKAENNDGIISANVKNLTIHIHPPFYLSVWAFILYTIIGAGLLMVYRKITIDKQKEKAALTYERMEKAKMNELNRQRLNFYTYISHEFKTPLSIIISSIDQLFGDQGITDELKQRLQRLNRNSKRLSFLFNQLMDFRKIETKHAKLVLQKGDIIGFIRETCLVFSPLYDQHRVNFEFKANLDEYEYWFDPDKIEKIIANLISNSLKHTPLHGQILCEIEVMEGLKGEQERLSICISDTGKGISEEDQRKLFTPFYVSYDHNEQSSGSGIGLTLVKSLVNYLHGTIEVKSKIDEGTRFIVQLPLNYQGISNIKFENSDYSLERNLDLESVIDLPSKPIVSNEEIDGEKEFKLLIVEDTVDLAEILAEHYAKGFQVKRAKNGLEALNIVKEEEPDIIISDVMMPEMDGFELCRRIKHDEATSHIAMILLTAKSTHEDKITGLQAGAEAFVRKPFDLNELDLHVRNFIEIRKKLKEKVVTGAHIDFEKLNFQDKDKEFIEKVSSIINDNLERENLNTEELAKELGMSKTLVYLKLKKLLNMSGSDYIQSLRFKKAIELMADPNRNISDISFEIGFSDPNYFSKVFKKVYKKTPSAFRKELLENVKRLKMS
ncbi:MAG: response regulator [Cytophagales bacterium]|nr:response regulator [Cytophagales bacterium]